MVLERVEIMVSPGQESRFEEKMREGVALLRAAEGVLTVVFGRGVESPSKFILLIGWDSIETHFSFVKTETFNQFRELVGPFYASKPSMEHFEVR
jgi:quinol monooxygenase YgiN